MTSTATPSTGAGAAGVTAPGTSAGQVAHRVRGALAWVLVLVVGGILLALAAGTPAPDEYLHPDGTGQTGARALVEVLGDQGVDVRLVGTVDDALAEAGDGRGTTVVVGNSDLLGESAARRLLRGTLGADRVVLLDGAPALLDRLGLGVTRETPLADPGVAGCDLPWVRPDDVLSRQSFRIVPTDDALPAGATGCYPDGLPDGTDDGRAPVGWASVDLPASERHARLTVVGFPDAATNRFVTESDHAGLVVRLLGGSPRLVWYHPTPQDLAANPSASSADSPWPAALVPASVLAALAVVVFALARGRRLGRLVPEPLPVVVRATETTESRAELYRAAADRHRAAAVLRRATTSRLRTRLGLAPGTPGPALTSAVADATGTPGPEVEHLLHGLDPTDDDALVALARQLAHLEEKVRTP